MPPLVEVHLRELPVELWWQTREHNDALHRELALIASNHDHPLRGIPQRLLDLVAAVDAWRTDVSSAQDDELFLAHDSAVGHLEDLVFELDERTALAADALVEVYAEADRWCADGRYLLTMPPSPDVVSYRTWTLRQFADQPRGRPAAPWPQWQGLWREGRWRQAPAGGQQHS